MFVFIDVGIGICVRDGSGKLLAVGITSLPLMENIHTSRQHLQRTARRHEARQLRPGCRHAHLIYYLPLLHKPRHKGIAEITKGIECVGLLGGIGAVGFVDSAIGVHAYVL